MSTPRSPSQDQALLAECFARKLHEGLPYSEETFRAAYIESLPPGTSETPRVCEQWASALWSKLRSVPVEQFVVASKQRHTLVALLYRLWGKAF
ncbi:hypothetical protein [Polaromonas jejuensis]|uniref:Uncharacterized protein n=1 Tax=Polaromonas jejuensis TaxID=457502 RepID=A0ABW0QHL0_9BURK|nr:hypothetical protein [Polaromonas jejuensis]